MGGPTSSRLVEGLPNPQRKNKIADYETLHRDNIKMDLMEIEL
jgi:hypothetical protein